MYPAAVLRRTKAAAAHVSQGPEPISYEYSEKRVTANN